MAAAHPPHGVAPIINPPPQIPYNNPADAIPGIPGAFQGQANIPPILWNPPPGMPGNIDNRLYALQDGVQIRKERELALNQAVFQAIQNVLITARNQSNGTTRVNTQALADLDNRLAQLNDEIRDPTNLDADAEADITSPFLNHIGPAAANPITVGGWTPKPRRNPTRRRPKKRKSLKSPF
jgi:hypothetical protein